MSIVLVIIGLIVGGVLVGQDLIRAAAVRAQITQIEKYQTAVNTFRGKYGYIPGDMNNAAAIQFGFLQRPGCRGEGDGNGVLEYNTGCGAYYTAPYQGAGENSVFWEDLTSANGLNIALVDGNFVTAAIGARVVNTMGWSTVSGTTLSLYFPEAKIGQGNYVYVYSTNSNAFGVPEGINFFGVANFKQIDCCGQPQASGGLAVRSAYAMDQKLDDGLPQSGRVLATNIGSPFTVGNTTVSWSCAGCGAGNDNHGAYPGNAATASATTCFDNGGSASNISVYSMASNGGAGVNCALSFQFQ